MKVYVQLRLRCELYCVGVQSSDSARGRLTFSASLLMTGGRTATSPPGWLIREEAMTQ